MHKLLRMNHGNSIRAMLFLFSCGMLLASGCKPDTSVKTHPAGEELVPYVEIADDPKSG